MQSPTSSRKSFVMSIVALCLSLGLVLLIVITQAFGAPISLFPILTPLPRNGLIAFEREDNYVNNIYVVEADDTSERLFLSNSYKEYLGSWSPDGTKLLYIPRGADADGIYVISADGRDNQIVVDNSGYFGYCCPQWRPDSKKVAVEGMNGKPFQIYIMNIDGTDQQGLIEATYDNDLFQNFYWSPNGKTILYTLRVHFGSDDEHWELHAIDADGTNKRSLVVGPASHKAPTWSPDGTQIAFQSDREGNWDIYVMNADGTNQRRISDSPVYDENPLWSPDGTQIAFQSGRVGKSEIYLMNVDGSNVRRLTDNYVTDRLLTWSPDGTQLLFASTEPLADGDGFTSYVYAINADGSNLRRLFSPGFNSAVSWQPIP